MAHHINEHPDDELDVTVSHELIIDTLKYPVGLVVNVHGGTVHIHHGDQRVDDEQPAGALNPDHPGPWDLVTASHLDNPGDVAALLVALEDGPVVLRRCANHQHHNCSFVLAYRRPDAVHGAPPG